MKRSIDPFWWGMFGAGGTISALVLPVLLVLNGLAIPLGWIGAPDYGDLLSFVKHPLTRILYFGIISLSLYHWAHRFRYTLYDGLQLKHLNVLVAVICYGSATLVTLLAGYTLWSI